MPLKSGRPGEKSLARIQREARLWRLLPALGTLGCPFGALLPPPVPCYDLDVEWVHHVQQSEPATEGGGLWL